MSARGPASFAVLKWRNLSICCGIGSEELFGSEREPRMEGEVSVIIPTYNRPRWLPEAIESILNQTYPHVEIIVVNDGSTDNTEQTLGPYRDRIKYIYRENGDPGSAANAGIMAATSEYIEIMDDILLEELRSTSTVYSITHAYDIRGAVFLRHKIYKRAGQEFYKSVRSDPKDVVHRFWYGMLLRQIGEFDNANECFSAVTVGHALYDAPLNAIELTSRLQSIDPEDEVAVDQVREDLNKEHTELMNMIIDIAKGKINNWFFYRR